MNVTGAVLDGHIRWMLLLRIGRYPSIINHCWCCSGCKSLKELNRIQMEESAPRNGVLEVAADL